MMARAFPLGVILTVTTGKFMSRTGLGAVKEFMSFLVGWPVSTHQVSSLMVTCATGVLAQQPELASIVPPETFRGKDHVLSWLGEHEVIFGEELDVTPLTGVPAQDPVADLVNIVGPDRVLVVEEP